MDCTQAQHELLTADDPGAASLRTDIAQHLRTCPACAKTLALLLRIEQTGRQLPVPDSTAARAAFLQALKPATPRVVPASRPRSARPRINWRSLAAAAVILIAVALTVLFLRLGRANRSLAEDTTVDRLLDWNLKIADEDSPNARATIFATQLDAMKSQVDRAALPADQRQLAVRLLENGSWLSTHPDPLESAEHFDQVASLVVDQLHAAATNDQAKAAARLTRQLNRLANQGLAPQMKRAKSARLEKPDRKKRYDRLVHNNEELNTRLRQILEASPNASRKEIRRQLRKPWGDEPQGDTKP